MNYPALGQFRKVIPGSTTNQDVTISLNAKANQSGIMLRSRLGNIGYKTGNLTLSTENEAICCPYSNSFDKRIEADHKLMVVQYQARINHLDLDVEV